MKLHDFLAYGISEAEKCECLQQAEKRLRGIVIELEDRVQEAEISLERLKSRRDTEWEISDGVLKDISSLKHEIDDIRTEKPKLNDELRRLQNTAMILQEESDNVKKAHRIELTQDGDVSSFHIVVKMTHDKPTNDTSIKLHEASRLQGCALQYPFIVPRMGMVDWAFSEARYRKGSVVVVPNEELCLENEPIFVAGDIHGDVESLRWVFDTALLAFPKSKVIFLGDLFDRGDEYKTLDALRLFVWALHAFSGRILWLKGNHDSLSYSEESGRFSSTASPHEFSDFLNAHSDINYEGRYLCDLIAQLPVAAVIGDVWISHGGILQDDDQGLRAFESFEKLTETMASDFMWSRMADVPSKLADRAHRGAEVGFEQATKFVDTLKSCTGIGIRHIVCGHQHLDQEGYGYVNFEKNYGKLLSCQCVCSFAHENVIGESVQPAILKLQPGAVPCPIFSNRITEEDSNA